MLYDDKQKEKLEEWDLMFVKAQPGVAKMKRKDSRAKEQAGETDASGRITKRPRSASLSSALSSSTPTTARGAGNSSPHPPQRNDSIVSLSATTPSPPSSTHTSPRSGSPYSSSSAVSTSPSSSGRPAGPPKRRLSATGSSGSLHFFELMTREETVRFLSPSERDNEEWVEIINRERDTLVTCMLLAGDDDGSDKADGKAEHNDATDAVDKDGKLSITESRRLLREIIEAEVHTEDMNSDGTKSDESKEETTTEMSSSTKEAETSDCREVEQIEEDTKESGEKKQKGSKGKRKSRRTSSSASGTKEKDRSLQWSSNLHCADCGEPQPGTLPPSHQPR
jgi:hypothetical protein